MKKLIVAAVAALASVGAANAADLPTKAPLAPAPMVAPAFSWTGFYIGVNGGWAWGHSTFDYNPPDVGHNNDGGLVGGTVGFNYQFAGPWVLGIEADWDWAHINGSSPCPNPIFSCETKIRSIGTARARGGYAINNLLLYVTGGFAWEDVKVQTVDLTGGPNPPSGTPTNGTTATHGGWTVGFGAEYALWQNLSLKLEYLHADFGHHDFAIDGGQTVSSRQREDMVRAGLNWRFGLTP